MQKSLRRGTGRGWPLPHSQPKRLMKRVRQARSNTSGAAASETGGSSGLDAGLMPVIRPRPATIRMPSARNTCDSLRVTIQTIAWGIDHHDDNDASFVIAQYRAITLSAKSL